ncbi:MAG: HlyD family efflux transporter periplasmic adaptor subunit [Fimbriimonadaceae bacterium]|nr:HlyD family efflux transporter periplasmic adaptor subunit [Fimbriimonadaceae bacterium]
MKVRRFMPLFVILVLVVAGIAVDRVRDAKRSELSGIFEAQPAKLSSRVGGRVAKILVREGDAVKKGQVLVRLEATPTEQDANAARALADQARLKSLEVEIGPRAEEIARQSAVVAELEAGLAALRKGSRPEEIAIGRQQLAQAEAALALAVAGPRPEDRAAAEAMERQANARYRAAQRGPTTEERRQAEARLASAQAAAAQARRDAERARALFEDGAVPKAAAEAAATAAATARAREAEAEQVLAGVRRGTPPEELEAARQAYEAARSQADAVRAGTRREDIARLRAARDAARQSLDLLIEGPRREDVLAAEARLRQAQAVLDELLKGATPEQRGQAAAGAAASEAQLGKAEDLVDEGAIVAPADGIVESVLVADGDLVPPGGPVIQFADPSDIWLRVCLPESQLSKVQVGDTAELKVDGLSDLVPAVVERIATQGEFTPANLQTPEERGKQVFAVRLRLARVESKIRAGMAATVKRVGGWQ